MNGQYSNESFDSSHSVKPVEGEINSPVANSDLFTNNVSKYEGPTLQAPAAETVAEVNPVNLAPVQEIPVEETVAVIGVVDEVVVDAAPLADTTPYPAPLVSPSVTGETRVVDLPVPNQVPLGETTSHESTQSASSTSPVPLLNREEAEQLRARWNTVQGKFVDEPRVAVLQADALVSEVIVQLTQMFASERTSLESHWNQGGDVSTEDLRQALQHYHAFFNRLVV